MRKFAEFAGARRSAREHAAHERLPRERLAAHQRERLDALVRHAAAHSPLYREYAGAALEDLPVLDKATMMERFDDLVTDRALRRDELLERVDTGRDASGRYRVMTTSGSSGRKGLFVYDREGWRGILTMFLRHSDWIGITPRVPRRRRIAAIGGSSPVHMTNQVAASVSVGVHRVMPLPVTAPIDEIVAALNRFRPDHLNAYPSMATRLAEEQLAGRLRISLRTMSTSSELRTPAMTERLVEAFGVHPFDLYATTEGLWGLDCEHHAGIHLFEDVTLVENVDAAGRPVPPGEPGARVLVTNLFNRVQPIIRLAVSDVFTLDPSPCPCGRTLARLRAVEGRSDDVLRLPGRDGAAVPVLPAHFACLTRDRDVREFQVVQRGDALRLLVVPREHANGGLDERLRAVLGRELSALGVAAPAIEVERRDELVRSPGGKLQIVVAER
jgi:phenylacetate-CoA ligase